MLKIQLYYIYFRTKFQSKILIFLLFIIFPKFPKLFSTPISATCTGAPDQFEFWYNSHFRYNDLGYPITADSFYKCMRFCLADTACNAFGFSDFDNVCWLKTQAGTLVEQPGYVTGKKCDHSPNTEPENPADGYFPGKSRYSY